MSKEDTLQEISIDDILEPAETARTVIVLEKLQELGNSIKDHGVIQPIIVLAKGDKYEIDAGHRRFLAAKMAGLLSVPCIIRAYDIKEADIVKLHENSFREEINPVDEGKFFVKLHEKHKLTFNEIAKLSNRSDSYVLNRVMLLERDQRVLAALEAGEINFSQAIEIDKAREENIRFELLRITIESGATVSTLRGMRYDYEKRISNQDPALVSAPPEPGNYPEMKHLIKCPFCNGAYPVNEIYPISVCKTCYDNVMKNLEGGEK